LKITVNKKPKQVISRLGYKNTGINQGLSKNKVLLEFFYYRNITLLRLPFYILSKYNILEYN